MIDISFNNPRKRNSTNSETTSQHNHISLELDRFYLKISKASTKLVIIMLVDPYAEKFIPKMCNVNYPQSLTELYDPKMLHVTLLKSCES